MTEEFAPVTPTPELKKNNTSTIIIITVAVLSVLCCCCIVIGVLLWNFSDQIFGISQLIRNLLV